MQREVSVSMRKGGGQKACEMSVAEESLDELAGYRKGIVVVVVSTEQETRARQNRRGALCLARLPHASSQAI